MTRRAPSPAETRRILIAQAFDAGTPIPCALCGEAMAPTDRLIREHLVPLALGGSDAPENIRFAHQTCAERKTNGNPATTAGSDRHAIAKAKRLAKGGKTRRGPKIPSRPFQKGRRKL